MTSLRSAITSTTPSVAAPGSSPAVPPAAAALSLRPVAIYLALVYGMVLTAALALPHMGVVNLISMLTPAVALGITIAVAVPRPARRSTWAAIGWRRPRLASVAVALLIPAVLMTFSYGMARVIGVARFPDLHISPSGSVNLAALLALGTFLALAEEHAWRGFVFPRLSPVLGVKRAAIITGAAHAAFHLPLLLLATTYQTDGNRLIIVPMVMVTITAGGVIYAWIRTVSGSIWPVAIMHNAFNTFVDLGLAASTAGSAAALAYVTTETGIFTLIGVTGLAGWLLTRSWAGLSAASLRTRPSART